MRKFMTTLLALVMLLSVAMPAFAAAATSPAELTEDTSSVDIPIIYNIEYTAGEFNPEVKDKIDRENRSYRVVVSWTTADGTVTIPGTYAWDAQTAQYITVKGKAADATVKAEASADIKIQNYSNAQISYSVAPYAEGHIDYDNFEDWVGFVEVSEAKWYDFRGQTVTPQGNLRFIDGYLPSASKNVAAAGQPVAESDIPAAHGSYKFRATNTSEWTFNGETEEVGHITVSFTIPQ